MNGGVWWCPGTLVFFGRHSHASTERVIAEKDGWTLREFPHSGGSTRSFRSDRKTDRIIEGRKRRASPPPTNGCAPGLIGSEAEALAVGSRLNIVVGERYHSEMDCPVGQDVECAAAIIREGGVVAFATETVYGLGANALDPTAVARVFEVKGRPRFDPLIVHVNHVDDAHRLTTAFPESAVRLANAFWPGPLTLVLPKAEDVPDLVTAGLSTVAVRVPVHPLARQLISQAGVPIAAPSANPFGEVSPTTAEHVRQQLGDRIDYLLDGGRCAVGVESTVLHVDDGRSTLLRPGGVTQEEIEQVIGPVNLPPAADANDEQPQTAPGMLSRHYAPRTPLRIVERVSDVAMADCTGLLTLQTSDVASRFDAVEVLSPGGDLCEAAANFYAAVRRLDAHGLEGIVATLFPDEGLGRALNDRLRRAARAH